LRARLTVWYSIALLAVIAILSAIVLWQQERIGVRRVDRELGDIAATLANVLQDELTEMPGPAEAALEVNRTMAVPNRAMAILDDRGRVMAATWNGLSMPTASLNGVGSRTWTAQTDRDPWRVRQESKTFGGRTFGILVGAPLTDVYRERREAQEALLVGIPIALILAAAGGLWLASVGLRPITEMASRAERLAPTGVEDLGESERGDELGQFARAFNGLVARLRQTLQTQRQFMADASHELRTPVSVVQSAADVTLSRERRDELEYREALAIVGAEARRLGRLVEDMLVLARADAGGYPLRRVSVYLDEIVADCRRSVDMLAQGRDVRVVTSAPNDVSVHGDEDLLRRMVLNVVRNAVQHTRPGTAVHVDLCPNGREVAIRVRDEGRGIADSDRARIFDRFVQLDASRRGDGVGLGLPIARWIAEAHGGTLELETTGESGSTFRMVLPTAPRERETGDGRRETEDRGRDTGNA
jgi:heavy metal sensor kinase